MARLEPEQVEVLADELDRSKRFGGPLLCGDLGNAADELRAGLRYRRRLSALKRAVAESAARGECVELDGRGSATRIEHWGPAAVLEQAADGQTLADALDALADAQEEVAGDAGLQG